MLELANLNLDGIAGMRSGGSVLEVPQAPMRGHSPASIIRVPVTRSGGLRPQGAPAPQRGHSPASIVRKSAVQNLREHRPRAGRAELYREREPGAPLSEY